jgi:hypothetical protein
VDWELLFANPTPFMFTELAYHVRTSSILFYPNVTLFTLTYNCSIGSCPILIFFVYFALAAFPWVINIKAIKAICLFAVFTN